MSRPVRGLLAALLCLPLLAAGAPTAAQAALLERSGWWWRLQTGVLVEVPPPEQVPDGGLHVASAPDGPTAIAAMRFELSGEERDPVLTLAVADDRGGDVALLQACPAASPWRPTEGGRWEDRPDAGCEEVAVEGSRADDGATWTFPLASLVRADRLDVVIVPGHLSEAPVGGWPSFELSFEPVDGSALTFAPPEQDGGGSTPPPEGGEPDALVFAPEGAEGGAPDGGGYDPPPSTGFGAPPGQAPEHRTAPDLAIDQQAGDEPAPAPQAAAPEEAVPAPEVGGAPPPLDQAAVGTTMGEPPAPARAPAPEGLGLLLLVACAGAGMVLSGGAPRQPQPLGSFARRRGGPPAPPEEARGIGRFARPRQGPAPSLL